MKIENVLLTFLVLAQLCVGNTNSSHVLNLFQDQDCMPDILKSIPQCKYSPASKVLRFLMVFYAQRCGYSMFKTRFVGVLGDMV